MNLVILKNKVIKKQWLTNMKVDNLLLGNEHVINQSEISLVQQPLFTKIPCIYWLD